MLLYEYKVRDEFERVRVLAERIKHKFETKAKAPELLQDRELLKSVYEQLRRILPSGLSEGNFERHLGFMEYYLLRNDTGACYKDIEDICKVDLTALEKSFRDWCASQEHYDAEFAQKVSPLLQERQLDSAVRKAFVLLKERLVKCFDLPSDQDGRNLVNQVFGREGLVSGKISESERESIRNLLDGLFGVFRNVYGHTDVETEWYEAEAILSMINWALKSIDKYSSLA
jgi:hypothetical protein